MAESDAAHRTSPESTPAADEPEVALGGFWSALTQLLTAFADIVYTRVELLFLDLQEAAGRVLSLLLWSLVGLFAAAMTLLVGALALILVFWDTHRVLVAVLVTAVFAALALTAMLVVARKARARQPFFAATLEELARDRQHFKFRP